MFLPGSGLPAAQRFGPRPLVSAAVTAVTTGLCTSHLGIWGFCAALLAAALIGVSQHTPVFLAIALPAGFAALPMRATFGLTEPMAPGPVRIEGTVCDRPRTSGFGDEVRFLLRTPHASSADVWVLADQGSATTPTASPRDNVPQPGDHLEGIGFLRAIDPGNAGSTLPVVETRLDAIFLRNGSASLAGMAARGRAALERGLRAHLSPANGDLVAQLVLGSNATIDEELLAAHRATGLIHLLAVSGAHASLLAFLLARLHGLVTGRDPYRARRFRRGAGAVLLIYGSITGFDAPVLRAIVAWLFMQIADGAGRRVSPASTLAVPALLTAFALPHDLDNPGFWLSYAAVIGLCVANSSGRRRGRHAALRRAAVASAWALVTTTPFTLAYFGQCAPWTILGTPLLAPLVAIMLGLGLVLALTATWLPPLAAPFALCLEPVCDLYAVVVAAMAKLPGAPITATRAPWLGESLAMILVAAAVLLVWTSRRGLFLACLATTLPYFVGGGHEAAQLRLCAVGHGQCLCTTLPDGTRIVVDCGSRGGSPRAARQLLDGLRGDLSIEWLILTHADLDHLAAVPHLAERVAIGNLVAPAVMSDHPIVTAMRARGIAIHLLGSGAEATLLPGVTVRAPALVSSSSNEQSLWTKFEVGGLTVLATGDADASAIAAMASAESTESPAVPDPANFLRCDVLVLPHHGRLDPVHADRLMQLCRPRLALASNGDRSPPALVQHLREAGRFVLTTAENGEIAVALDGSRRITAARSPRLSATSGDETPRSR